MGTEILRPQDCLIERMGVCPVALPCRKPYAGNSRSCRRQAIRPEPRKRFPQAEPSISKKSTASSDDSRPSSSSSSSSSKGLVMGQVTILKRGETLESKRRNEYSANKTVVSRGDLVVRGTQRLGPEPEMISKQIWIGDLKSVLPPAAVRSDVYAGSVCSLSPSPSALPLPNFSKKKDGPAIVDDSATKDLRRLLRLD